LWVVLSLVALIAGVVVPVAADVRVESCFGQPATYVGTSGDDTIVGTEGDDVIVGGDGDDVLKGLGGNDRICGGAGEDTLIGGPGKDKLKGDAGDDVLKGNGGGDRLIGSDGNDRLVGGGGNDVLKGNAGQDNLNGGPGADKLNGGGGTDSCTGEELHSCEPETSAGIGSIWANDGGDKVLRDELRATVDSTSVLNSVWDGTAVTLFGARNEVVAFNLVLEASDGPAVDVEVRLTSLDGPGDAQVGTRDATGNGVFDYVGRNIELFYVRYLKIEGLSVLSYETYDERHIPEGCRRPHTAGDAVSGTGWEDRPCHDRFYPDIAVPLELETPFGIPAAANQSIWGDITIPADTRPGRYEGTIEILESGTVTHQVPIRLQVVDFTLPELPTARTMAFYSEENLNERYLGDPFIGVGDPRRIEAIAVQDRHFQLAHRHRISLIDGYQGPARLSEAWIDRLDGDLFTPTRGYEGPGEGVGNNVYSIGTYGSWPWFEGTRQQMWNQTNAWVRWFDDHPFATPTDYFLYLIDESDNFAQIEQWAGWIDDNPGPGNRLPSMATVAVTDAVDEIPSLDIPASASGIGLTSPWQSAANAVLHDPGRRLFMYNGTRPATGSLAIEDEGVALRQLAWTQYKKGIDRWFVWETTYYDNFQCYGGGPRADTNVFRQAQTYGCDDGFHRVLGHTGWNYNNGDGVLFYPGTDLLYPTDSYGVNGPFASLRLKHWRRGIQDVEYLTMAAAVDPARTRRLVEEMIPEVLWEYRVNDPDDPTWVLTDVSWSIDPDDWEAVRSELAGIIEGG
jgi:hypothetical protein